MKLLETTQKFEALSEIEAKDLIEQFRTEAAQKGYIVKKAGYEHKEKKTKGEVVAECWIVSITQIFGSLWEEV